ncbi:MAG: hypothetical protein KFF77_02575 [Bacteroidetes bacterium]|nr:hypothetical protein [Bacteroidota bacterium]
MGSGIGRFAFACILVVVLGGHLHAQTWDTIPPPLGGRVSSHARHASLHYAVVCDETNWDSQPSTPYLFRSTNDGGTWQSVSLPAGMEAFRHTLLLDGPNRLYYLNEQKLFRTTDNGASWLLLRVATDASSSMTELRCDVTGRLYLMIMSEGVFTSTDHGMSWMPCTRPSGRQLILYTHLACVGSDLYLWWGNVAVTADTLFRSSDHGKTWSPFLTGMIPRDVIDGGSGRVIVTRSPILNGVVPLQILATGNGGAQWDTLYLGKTLSGGGTPYATDQSFVRGANGRLAYRVVDSTSTLGVLLSTDDGMNWSFHSDRSMEYAPSISFSEANELLVYGTRLGMLRYPRILADAEHIGFIPMTVNRPPVPSTGMGILACTSEEPGAASAFWREAGSSEWRMVLGPGIRSGTLQSRSATTLFLAPPDTIYASIGTFCRSTDFGRHWTTLFPGGALACGNTSEQRGTWIISSYDSIRVSTNKGRLWTSMSLPPQRFPERPGGVAEVDATTLHFYDIDPTLWRRGSLDTSWTSRALPWRTEELITGRGNLLYVRRSRSGEFMRSSDLGDTWEEPNPGYGTAHALLMVGPDTLIALDTTRGIAMSPDRGNSWTLVDLSAVQPRSIALHEGILYVGTRWHGILHTHVSGTLSAFSSLQPTDGSECQPTAVVLRWDAPSLAAPYRIRCALDVSFASGMHIDTTIQATELPISGLLPGMTYYWDLSAMGSGGQAVRSMISRFTVAVLPSIEITDPSEDARCIDPIGIITWTGQSCVEYSDVEFAFDQAFQSPALSIHVEGDTVQAVYSLSFGTQYHARVRSTSASGTGPWSRVVSFRTIDDTVTAPLQSEPADGSRITAGPPGFIRWEKVDCVRNSEIVVARAQDFSADTVAHMFKQDPYNYIVMSGGQWRNGTYYWKVRAWRDTVPGQWSPTWSFTIDIPVGVEAIAPAADFRILRVYPMPAGGQGTQVIVDCVMPGTATGVLVVCDLLGRERLRVPLSPAATEMRSLPVDVSLLPVGQYLIGLQDGTRRASAPLVIVR